MLKIIYLLITVFICNSSAALSMGIKTPFYLAKLPHEISWNDLNRHQKEYKVETKKIKGKVFQLFVPHMQLDSEKSVVELIQRIFLVRGKNIEERGLPAYLEWIRKGLNVPINFDGLLCDIDFPIELDDKVIVSLTMKEWQWVWQPTRKELSEDDYQLLDHLFQIFDQMESLEFLKFYFCFPKDNCGLDILVPGRGMITVRDTLVFTHFEKALTLAKAANKGLWFYKQFPEDDWEELIKMVKGFEAKGNAEVSTPTVKTPIKEKAPVVPRKTLAEREEQSAKDKSAAQKSKKRKRKRSKKPKTSILGTEKDSQPLAFAKKKQEEPVPTFLDPYANPLAEAADFVATTNEQDVVPNTALSLATSPKQEALSKKEDPEEEIYYVVDKIPPASKKLNILRMAWDLCKGRLFVPPQELLRRLYEKHNTTDAYAAGVHVERLMALYDADERLKLISGVEDEFNNTYQLLSTSLQELSNTLSSTRKVLTEEEMEESRDLRAKGQDLLNAHKKPLIRALSFGEEYAPAVVVDTAISQSEEMRNLTEKIRAFVYSISN